MTLTPGSRLAQYEIVASVGEGGMGEVYRARDTKLGREVAIKVVLEAFVADRERLVRFEREARALATLNHPNIATLHGMEECDERHFLVMELVEGQTLAEHIARGPIALDHALAYARQVAEALEAAHEKGIVHRDLKPANIKITPDDKVKVLDFGLAKSAADADAGASSVTLLNSPTFTEIGTEVGVILGTAAYMSPEQARGRVIDKRSDIWAFGAVLFEMLSGRRAFAGDDVSDLLVAVLTKDVDWAALPAGTPAAVTRLLRRCLERDAKLRLRDIGEARVLLSSAGLGDEPALPVAAPQGRRLATAFACLAVALAAVAAAGWWRALRSAAPIARPPSRFTLRLPPEAVIPVDAGPLASLAVSKDGRLIAWVAGVGPRSRVFVRRLNDPAVVPLAGTDGASKVFFSPDGESVAFIAGNQLKKIATAGGAPVVIVDAPQQFSGAWNDDNTIVLGGRSGLVKVAVAGGRMEPVVSLRPGEREYSNPQWLPGSKNVLFTIEPDSVSSYDDAKIAVVAPGGQPKILVEGGAVPTYLPSGHILYVRGGSIMAVPFDAARLEVTGKPRAVASGGMFEQNSAEAVYGVSPAGTVVYAPGGPRGLNDLAFALIDRQGTITPVAVPQRFYAEPAFSHDGRSLALTVRSANDDVWIYDLDRAALARVTVAGGDNQTAAWSPDGARLVYWNNGSNGPGIYWRATDGSGEERLTTATGVQEPGNFTPDGRALAFVELRPRSKGDVYVLDMKDRQTRPLLASQFDETFPRFSPDGRWLAYVSDEGGEPEVFVVPYPGPGRKVRVSIGGGNQPSWRKDGREIVYRARGALMSVDLSAAGDALQPGAPKVLLQLPDDTRDRYSMSPDGSRFAILRGPPVKPIDELVVVLDWLDELKELVPESKVR